MTTLAALLSAVLAATPAAKPAGILLEDLTWVEAEKVLNAETVVVIPLGAQAKVTGSFDGR